jgi:hypothetical protein
MSNMSRGGTALRNSSTRSRSLAQTLALLFGLTFLLVGIAGFIPGITGDYDELSFLGTDSDAELLGLFRVSILHNIVHMLFGVGILAARRHDWSKLYLLGGGIAYVLVSAYGFIIDEQSDANFLPINTADNFLHVALSLALLGAGIVALAADRRETHV